MFATPFHSRISPTCARVRIFNRMRRVSASREEHSPSVIETALSLPVLLLVVTAFLLLNKLE